MSLGDLRTPISQLFCLLSKTLNFSCYKLVSHCPFFVTVVTESPSKIERKCEMSPIKDKEGVDAASAELGKLSLKTGQNGTGSTPTPREEGPTVYTLQLESGPETIVVKKPQYLDCPPNWATNLKCGANVWNPTTMKFISEWLEVHEKRLADVLRSTPTEYFFKKTLAATYLAYGPEENATAASFMLDKIARAVKELDGIQFSEQYKEGLMNMILTTKLEIQMNFGVITIQKVKFQPRMLAELSDKAKCPVLAAKVYFCRLAQGTLQYRKKLVELILEYEDDRAEWHFLHHSILRDCRHQDAVRFRHRPDGSELAALGKAFTLDPENQEIVVSLVKTLFDCLKQQKIFYTQIGSLEYRSREEMENHLFTLVTTAANEDKNSSVRGLLAAAQVIGYFRMPEDKRDVAFAETLLNKALELWPTNSKILCRIGLHLMTEKRDTEGAKAKFHQAMTEEPSDAVSILNYYWIDSATIKPENADAIDKFLKSEVATRWPEHTILDFLFLKGCILFSAKKTTEAMSNWFKARSIELRYFMTKLHSLRRTLRKYSWKFLLEDGKEVDMYDDHIQKCIAKYQEALPPEEAEDGEVARLLNTLKMIKAAHAKPRVPEDNASAKMEEQEPVEENE